MNKKTIKTILPHRDPFLFVDEIIELRQGEYAKGVKYLDPSLSFFAGHFPNKPVMPGVLVLEALAQVGAIAALSKLELKGKLGYLTSVKNAKFRKMVLPGDTLVLEMEIIKLRSSFGFGYGKAFVNDILVCEAKIGFAVK